MRREFPTRIKVERFQFADGLCEGIRDGMRCGAKLTPGHWECDHDDPDAMTGKPTFENARCLCIPCHLVKTKADVGKIAKAKRNYARHIGASRPKGNWGAGRATAWKQLIGGRTVPR
jgi:5-methylcytosine-specific restriction protein A